MMFAAARFADLPELRELRTMFSERYGKSLDYYVNKQVITNDIFVYDSTFNSLPQFCKVKVGCVLF